MLSIAQSEIFAQAVNAIAAHQKRPLLYGPNGRPLATLGNFTYSRTAAKREGSMKTWIPLRLGSSMQEALERERIVERSIDLTNSDAHGAGVIDTFCTTVIGPGLTPHPTLDMDILKLEKEQVRQLQIEQRSIYQTWTPFADAGGRMTFGAIQYLIQRSLLQFGEYLVLLPMLKDTSRPYNLACQVIHPLRLKTPSDKVSDGRIKDGVEIGNYGEPIAYWIKKVDLRSPFAFSLPDTSKFFMRIPVKRGHRWNVLHGFIMNDPEQVRGIPFFAPAMKVFRDLNDYLDAELVSNIVTAAFSMFIETAGNVDPLFPAANLASRTETRTTPDGESEDTRYQEMIPGMIMYGSPGEKPHAIAANRPSETFEPFIKTIKKSIAQAVNLPYPVLFKDVENINFAGFRSAMLDAWRVFSMRRAWIGQGFCQPIYTMLMEEAFLRGDLGVADFYAQMWPLTKTEWRGPPKGDIEPIKAVKADVLAIQNHLKTRSEAIAERGGDLGITLDQLEFEEEILEEKGLKTEALNEPDMAIESDQADQGEGER